MQRSEGETDELLCLVGASLKDLDMFLKAHKRAIQCNAMSAALIETGVSRRSDQVGKRTLFSMMRVNSLGLHGR